MKAKMCSLGVMVALTLAARAADAQGTSPQNYPPEVLNATGCGVIYTYNATNNWVWFTIYLPDEEDHMDWGWVGPHMDRRWTGGGMDWVKDPILGFQKDRYRCGLEYVVRAEVKKGPPANTPNIADTKTTIGLDGKSSERVCFTLVNGTYFGWNSRLGCIQDDPYWQKTGKAAAPPR
jgi:hypothetical protein